MRLVFAMKRSLGCLIFLHFAARDVQVSMAVGGCEKVEIETACEHVLLAVYFVQAVCVCYEWVLH